MRVGRIAYPADLGAYAERLAADLAGTGPMMVELRSIAVRGGPS